MKTAPFWRKPGAVGSATGTKSDAAAVAGSAPSAKADARASPPPAGGVASSGRACRMRAGVQKRSALRAETTGDAADQVAVAEAEAEKASAKRPARRIAGAKRDGRPRLRMG